MNLNYSEQFQIIEMNLNETEINWNKLKWMELKKWLEINKIIRKIIWHSSSRNRSLVKNTLIELNW